MNFLKDFNNALSAEDYIELLGDQKQLHQLHYKKAELTNSLPEFESLKILVITEPWCGDSLAIFPVLLKMFEGRSSEIKVALRDGNPELIDQFLTNGGRAIPIILVLNDSGYLIMKFGPRPKKSQDIFELHRKDIAEGKIEKKEVIQKIRNFYSRDRGNAISIEFINQLTKSLSEISI